jgi:hypothetical protein
MGALETYLEKAPGAFDVTGLLDPDIDKIANVKYHEPLIYKYFSQDRRGFFAAPQFRFSQREALNDPFEMTRRWNTAKVDGLKLHLRQRLRALLPDILANVKLQIDFLNEQLEQGGQNLSEADRKRAETMLSGDEGEAFRHTVMAKADLFLGPILDGVFGIFEGRFDETVETIVSRFGILSLTEDPLSRAMWSYYASAGTGFVIGVDPQHPFFVGENVTPPVNVLRKVIYSDNRIENFWQNPYSLFLVKNTDYCHEREWRMFKKLADCDQRIEAEPLICLWNIPPEMIRSVHFGYTYNPASIPEDIAALDSVGAKPDLHSVRANRETGGLDAVQI